MTTSSDLVVSYWNSTSNHNVRLMLIPLNLVVSYWNSTSNHNSEPSVVGSTVLYLIEILHQTTTIVAIGDTLRRCILLKFYIKPQQNKWCALPLLVVSYWNSTSNHNKKWHNERRFGLYLIEILHQTTTLAAEKEVADELYLIEILHQTTTESSS